MPKKLELTSKVRDLIISATGGDVNPAEVSVYEASVINSLPITGKRGTLFENAVHGSQTLREMADVVSARPITHVPIHVMHDQRENLPVGKHITAQVFNEDGIDEVRALFYLPNSEKVLVDKLESGVIEEVSVGLRYKHINCSQCGWDYLGEEASDENVWYRTCPNEHQIGVDGVHAILNGLDKWLETSLVSLGAAQKVKIIGRTKSLLGTEAYNALAATGHNPSLTTLYASATPLPEKESMDLSELVKQVTKLSADLALSQQEVTNLKKENEKISELQAKVTEKEAEIAALKSTGVEQLTKDKTNLMSFVRSEADRLAVAAGESKLADAATPTELQASIEKHRKTLADRFPPEGRSVKQGGDDKDKSIPSTNAFKTR